MKNLFYMIFDWGDRLSLACSSLKYSPQLTYAQIGNGLGVFLSLVFDYNLDHNSSATAKSRRGKNFNRQLTPAVSKMSLNKQALTGSEYTQRLALAKSVRLIKLFEVYPSNT